MLPSDFSGAQLETYTTLLGMDISPIDARRAVESKGPNIEACFEYIFATQEQTYHSEGIPPLVPINDHTDLPPAYGVGVEEWRDWSSDTVPTADLTKAPPGSPATSILEITSSNTPPPSSQLLLGAPDVKSKYATSFKGKEKEKEADVDAELNAAMEASLSNLEENDRPSSLGELRKAEDRIRLDLSEPAILRSLSPLLSGLSAYFQCLYAVPLWRQLILDFATDSENVRQKVGFENYWKGSHETVSIHNDDEKMLGLQRLFALMSETRRSYLHIEEIVDTLDLIMEDYRFGPTLPEKLTAIHGEIGQMCTRYARQLLFSSPEGHLFDDDYIQREATSYFAFTGIQILKENMREPLPDIPFEEEMNGSSEVLKLAIKPGETLFRALDTALCEELEQKPAYSLLITPPQAFTLQFTRFDHIESLDGFGDADVEKNKNQVLDLPRNLWLDRYCLVNKAKIADGRELQEKLEKEILDLEKKRKKLAVTEDGKSGLELVKTALSYFQQATSEDPLRVEKQKALAVQYELVLDVMIVKIAEYENRVAELRSQYDSIFETPDMQQVGPFELRSFIMRNGLNGRGSSWSIIKEDDGQWWKIDDLEKTKVDVEQALKDPTGLQMGAGITMAFYQRARPVQNSQLPGLHLLRDAIRIDNQNFANELPSELTSNWDIDHTRPYEIIDMTNLRSGMDSTTPEAMEISQPASLTDGEILEFDGGVSTGFEGGLNSDKTEVEMIELVSDTESDGDKEVCMALRGGAGDMEEDVDEDDDDDDDDDDEGENEDEVELGCLVPMKKGTEWDVDFNVGKVGGKPIWLDPQSPLTTTDVTCGVCGRLMNFLLQLNSPDDERPHAAARSLYIFACAGNTCISKDAKKSLKVWRVQTPSPNAFFPKTDATIAARKLLESTMDPITGLANHSSPISSVLPPYPEFDIETEEEPYEESYLPQTIPPPTLPESTSSEDTCEPNTSSGVDVAFLKFQERLARLPEQVLRFYRLPGIVEPGVLWVSAERVQEEKEVGRCEICGAGRKVEFQILSTLLSYISVDLDFDSILIYTCLKHCLIPPRVSTSSSTKSKLELVSGWQEEVIIKLNFSEGGARLDGLRPESE